MEVTDLGNSQFKETPVKWLIGPKATAVVAYRQTCCPEHSVLLFAGDTDGDPKNFKYSIVDDPRTILGGRQRFVGKVFCDDRDQLGHAYKHINHIGHHCGHHATFDISRPVPRG